MDILVVTIIGVLIASLTLLYQTHPHLRESTTTDHSNGKFTIKVKNTGKGAAKIIRMTINAYGISTDNEADDDFIAKMARPIDMAGNPSIEFYIWEKGDVVASGEELKVFEAKIPKAVNNLEKTFASLNLNVAVTATYRSVLGIPYWLNNRTRKI